MSEVSRGSALSPGSGADSRLSLALSDGLLELGRRLSSATTAAGVLDAALDMAARLLGGSQGAVLLPDTRAEGGEELRLAARWRVPGSPDPASGELDDGIGGSWAGEALRADGPLLQHPSSGRTGARVGLPLTLDGRALGLMVLDFAGPRPLTPAERRFLELLALQCAVALGRARLAAELDARPPGEGHEALEAFARFTEAATRTADVLALAREASTVLRAALGEVNVVYYELEASLWRARVWSEGVVALYLEAMQAGFPEQTERFARSVLQREMVVTEDWAPGDDGLPALSGSRTRKVAMYPYFVQQRPWGMLSVSSHQPQPWSSRERLIIRAVGRGLALALEREAQARQRREDERLQQEQADALVVQTLVLEGFARFSHDLGTLHEPAAVVRRAQEVMLGLLPEGYSVYYELEQGVWRCKAQVGELTPELQRLVDAGRPYGESLVTDRAWETGEPVYQDGYDPTIDSAGTLGSHIRASATLPVLVSGRPRGVLRVGLTGDIQGWSRTDRIMLETLSRQLGIVLAGADQAAQLEGQRETLAAQTRVLEAFAAFSHDLTQLSDLGAVIRRAQEIVLSLLPPGYALYYEPQGEHWRLRGWTASTPDLGPPPALGGELRRGESGALDLAWTSGQPRYRASRQSGGPGALPGEALGAVASLPVLSAGQPCGVLLVVLREAAQEWSPIHRVTLQTLARHLGLVLEGVQRSEVLRARTAELQRSNEELERFAYIASHDLQEPLRTIGSFTELLTLHYGGGEQGGRLLDERAQRYLTFINSGSQRMKRLVDDLLAFSRLDAQRQPLREVDAWEPLSEALMRLEVRVAESGARISCRQEDMPLVLGDAPQLAQLFQNLLGNALKFCRPGVLPEVQLRVCPAPAGSVPTAGGPPMWQFTVSDNGIGMEPEYFEQIFEMFRRLGRREEYEGSGLGLSICKKIVERHGGRIWLESAVGVGTRFHFTLPGPEGARDGGLPLSASPPGGDPAGLESA